MVGFLFLFFWRVQETPNRPKIFNAHRLLTPIPAIPKRRLRALDRHFGGHFFVCGVTSRSSYFGGFPGFLFGVSYFLIGAFFPFISPKFPGSMFLFFF